MRLYIGKQYILYSKNFGKHKIEVGYIWQSINS